MIGSTPLFEAEGQYGGSGSWQGYIHRTAKGIPIYDIISAAIAIDLRSRINPDCGVNKQ